MQWTGLNELREKYLSFFESKGHLRLDSFPLVPKNDPSLLLINSGMAPMKKWFLAQEEPPRHRVTTCQKCIRTPDIERVGITVNKNSIPNEPRSPFVTSGIRVGSAAATTRGLGAQEFRRVGELIAATVFANGDEAKLTEIKEGVKAIIAKHPLYPEL